MLCSEETVVLLICSAGEWSGNHPRLKSLTVTGTFDDSNVVMSVQICCLHACSDLLGQFPVCLHFGCFTFGCFVSARSVY